MGTTYGTIGPSDGVTFAFADPRVTRIEVDHRLTLLLADGGMVVIEEPCHLTRPDGSTVLVPPGDDAWEVGEALPLFGARVVTARATAAGELEVSFDDGRSLVVPVSPAYESWTVRLVSGELWVGTPGGGVARFPPSS